MEEKSRKTARWEPTSNVPGLRRLGRQSKTTAGHYAADRVSRLQELAQGREGRQEGAKTTRRVSSDKAAGLDWVSLLSATAVSCVLMQKVA